jgi:hypothetical protein
VATSISMFLSFSRMYALSFQTEPIWNCRQIAMLIRQLS